MFFLCRLGGCRNSIISFRIGFFEEKMLLYMPLGKIIEFVSCPHSKGYNKNCRGLGNCKGEIKQISLEEAKKKGRTPCGYCYR